MASFCTCWMSSIFRLKSSLHQLWGSSWSWWGSGHAIQNIAAYWVLQDEAVWEKSRSREITLTPAFLPWNRSWHPSWRGAPHCTPRKGTPYLWRQRDSEYNPNIQASLFPLLYLPHTLWPVIFLHDCPLFIKPSKYSGLTVSLGVT